jgi:transposase
MEGGQRGGGIGSILRRARSPWKRWIRWAGVVGTAEFSNDPRGHRVLLRWVGERGPDRVIGIECSLSYGATLSGVLLRSGEDVREVPTTLTHRQRRPRASQGKSDMVDSVAIARIVASGEVLPSAHRLEVLADLRALVEYRDQLVRARTQVTNRTHADLVNVLPGCERQVPNLRPRRTGPRRGPC